MNDTCQTIQTKPAIPEITFTKNSVGSEYAVFKTDEETVIKFSKLPLEKIYPRVYLDPDRGLIMLMTPSYIHEYLGKKTERIISYAACRMELSYSELGSTRLSGSRGGYSTGPEPDECYYIGNYSEAFLEAREKGTSACTKFINDHGPDLVVEVGVTSINGSKLNKYQELGVKEHWQINFTDDVSTPITVEFKDLQNDNLQTIKVSNCLPILNDELVQDILTHCHKKPPNDVEIQAITEYFIQQQTNIPSPQIEGI